MQQEGERAFSDSPSWVQPHAQLEQARAGHPKSTESGNAHVSEELP